MYDMFALGDAETYAILPERFKTLADAQEALLRRDGDFEVLGRSWYVSNDNRICANWTELPS